MLHVAIACLLSIATVNRANAYDITYLGVSGRDVLKHRNPSEEAMATVD